MIGDMELKPKFLELFKKYSEGKKGKLFGDSLVIEILDELEVKTKSGLIVQTSSNQRSQYDMLKSVIAVVLEVGEGYFDDDSGADIPLKRKVGEVVWINEMSVRKVTTFPGYMAPLPEAKLGIISDTAIYKAWDSIEAFRADMELLND